MEEVSRRAAGCGPMRRSCGGAVGEAFHGSCKPRSRQFHSVERHAVPYWLGAVLCLVPGATTPVSTPHRVPLQTIAYNRVPALKVPAAEPISPTCMQWVASKASPCMRFDAGRSNNSNETLSRHSRHSCKACLGPPVPHSFTCCRYACGSCKAGTPADASVGTCC